MASFWFDRIRSKILITIHRQKRPTTRRTRRTRRLAISRKALQNITWRRVRQVRRV